MHSRASIPEAIRRTPRWGTRSPRPPQEPGDGSRRRPILCAIDDDALAETVVAAAGELSQSLGLPLVFVHSVDPDLYVVGEAFRRRRAEGESFVRRLTARHPRSERIVELGRPADLIAAVASDEDAALVVIGRRHRRALTAAILGSVSHAVARRVTCPVVIVPAENADLSALGDSGGVTEARSR